ncbi:MAG: hypothetical protein H6Q56_264 [Deltaproteobacteria bacterium]|nr:hypothetical protein [Deltaproteobacteria bacterium]
MSICGVARRDATLNVPYGTPRASFLALPGSWSILLCLGKIASNKRINQYKEE